HPCRGVPIARAHPALGRDGTVGSFRRRQLRTLAQLAVRDRAQAAREKVRVAPALTDLPLISAAYRDGRLSYSKVRAITRVATAETEADYVEIATSATAAPVEKIVRKLRQVVSLDARAAAAAFDRYRQRELMLYPIDDGVWTLRGQLTPEQG